MDLGVAFGEDMCARREAQEILELQAFAHYFMLVCGDNLTEEHSGHVCDHCDGESGDDFDDFIAKRHGETIGDMIVDGRRQE